MSSPPPMIDGARVLRWAWSGEEPHFHMASEDGVQSVPVFGLAICIYADSGAVYRFSCNAEWETENDTPHDSLEDASTALHAQYDVHAIRWREYA